MPRIRYLKSWDFTLYEDNNHDTPFDEQTDETSNRSRREIDSEESEAISGNSWLSNANIIAQLSDARIKESIRALKAQIKLMENELLSRHIEGRHVTSKGISKIGRLRPVKDGDRIRSPRKDNERSSKQFKKVASLRRTLKKLGVKDVNALLNEWSKINKGESDET